MRWRLILAAFLAACLGIAGATSAASAAEEHVVETKDNVFAPESITVQAGDSVTFENTGQLPHTATADDGSWDTGNLNAGQSKSITFENEGTFSYNCIYHRILGMVGSLEVVAAGASVPDPPVAGTSPAPSPEAAPEAVSTQAAPRERQPTEKYFLPLAGLLTLAMLGAVALGYLRTRKKLASLS
jgi:plastocyanin